MYIIKLVEIGARSTERQNNVAECDMEVRSRKVYETIVKGRDHFITPKLSGGLGNNLFQIANAFALSEKYDLNLIIDYSQQNAANYKDNTFRPHYTNTIFSRLKNESLELNSAYTIRENGFEYTPLDITVSGNILVEGHYQSHKIL